MESYLMALDVDVWFSILNGEKSKQDEKAKRIILKWLLDSDSITVRHCESTREIWENI